MAARNNGSARASVQLRLHSRDGVKSHEGSIEQAEQGVFEDVVGMMGYTGKWCLEVRSDQPLLVSGRIFNQADEGTFGQFVQGYPFGEGLSHGESTWLLQLRQQKLPDEAHRLMDLKFSIELRAHTRRAWTGITQHRQAPSFRGLPQAVLQAPDGRGRTVHEALALEGHAATLGIHVRRYHDLVAGLGEQ